MRDDGPVDPGRLVDAWWRAHIAPQSRRALGNIGDPHWRPRTLLAGLPVLVAVLVVVPVAADRAGSAVARYAGWGVCLAVVFGYVAAVTTGRAGFPLRGRHGGFRDVLVVQVIGLLVFLLAGGHPGGGHPLLLAAGLFVGTHVSYAEKLPRAWNRSLAGAEWRAGVGRRHLVVRVGLLAAGVVALAATASGWALLIVGVIVLVVVLVRRDGFTPHVHHWFVFALLAMLGASTAVVLGVCMGACAEGAARWSCAPLWHRSRP